MTNQSGDQAIQIDNKDKPSNEENNTENDNMTKKSKKKKRRNKNLESQPTPPLAKKEAPKIEQIPKKPEKETNKKTSTKQESKPETKSTQKAEKITKNIKNTPKKQESDPTPKKVKKPANPEPSEKQEKQTQPKTAKITESQPTHAKHEAKKSMSDKPPVPKPQKTDSKDQTKTVTKPTKPKAESVDSKPTPKPKIQKPPPKPPVKPIPQPIEPKPDPPSREENVRKPSFTKNENPIVTAKTKMPVYLSKPFIGRSGSFVKSICHYTKTKVNVDTVNLLPTDECVVTINGLYRDVILVLQIISAIIHDNTYTSTNIIDQVEFIRDNFKPNPYTIISEQNDRYSSAPYRQQRAAPPTVSVTDVPTFEYNKNVASRVPKPPEPPKVSVPKKVEFESGEVKSPPGSCDLVESSSNIINSTIFKAPNIMDFNVRVGRERTDFKSASIVKDSSQCPLWDLLYHPKNNVGISFDRDLWMKTSIESQPLPKKSQVVVDKLQSLFEQNLPEEEFLSQFESIFNMK